MKRSVFPFLCLVVVMLVIGSCSNDSIDRVPVKSLSEFPVKRMEAAYEWRDVRRVGGDEAIAFDLGTAGAGSALRIGFFDAANAGNGGSIRVYAGDRRFAQWRLERRGAWRDERIVLDAAAGAPMRLVVETAQPVPIASCEVVPPATNDNPPNVLVFLIDTLRQDRMSTYGHTRETSPNITTLAAEGTLMTHLTPSSSWTRPSVASLFTSQHPNYHGAQTIRDKIREGLPSLAESLAAKGYETQGLMTNANCLPVWGFGGGFARYVDVDSLYKDREKDDGPVTDAALAAIEHLRGRPWFLYVHTMGPHIPYAPPEPFRTQFATDLSGLEGDAREIQRKIDLYDAEIAFTDHQFGRVVETLKATGQYDNTLIVVLSDHGEEFMDHGNWEHAKTLYEEMLRVPLIIKPPKGAWPAPSRVDALVEMIDVAPTVLEVVGAEVPVRFQGRSFLPLIRGESEPPRTAFASLNQEWWSLRATKTIDHKYIRDVVKNTESWFDLVVDPRETQPMPAPEWGGPLRDLAAALSLGGASGLHVLLIGVDAPAAAELTLRTPGLGEAHVINAEWENAFAREGDTLHWTLSDKKSFRVEVAEPGRQPWQAVQRVHAHLSVQIPVTGEVQIDARVAGAPVDPAQIYLGRARNHGALENATLKLADVLAHPDDFDLAGLPQGFGVYVWYVAGPESLTDEAVPTDVREALEALGYVQ